MLDTMALRIWNVEHGACAMLHHTSNFVAGRLAMIDSGDTPEWTPATFIRDELGRTQLDYLFITNADQDHMSGLQDLWDEGINVPVMNYNPTFGPAAFEAVKRQSGPLTRDAQRYLQNLRTFTAPIAHPFDTNMGGITMSLYWNPWPYFTTTNDLSLVVSIKYGPFSILFPGDLEVAGWRNHLRQESFRNMLADVDILVASHHGRESGYCEDVFEFCHPQAIVMSDKAIVHDTQQMSNTYRSHVTRHHPNGVLVRSSGNRRHVLTTRSDGWIQFEVEENGTFTIDTEFQR